MSGYTASQKYLSTRGGSYGVCTFQSYHEAQPLNGMIADVLRGGLASDRGLFIPEEIPSLPRNWSAAWTDLSFADLAAEILSLYISPSEIPYVDLKDILHRSYSTFRTQDITPIVTLDKKKNLHLLELFHGPTFAFKDVALQFLGNLFEYFLLRRNQGKTGRDRHHLTVIGATSGDTGSAAIYGLRGKSDCSVFILHPKGRVSPIQEAQMTTVLDKNVHNLAVEGTFDDCQDMVKALFADENINKSYNVAAVNSINWARILAQITYYFYAYFSLVKSAHWKTGAKIRFVVPTGNFGDVLAGYFAKRMGLPIASLVIATNENDILDRFWRTGQYQKHPVHGKAAEGGLPADGVNAQPEGVKGTYSPAMDILVSSNFERLLWFLAFQVYPQSDITKTREVAGKKVQTWLKALKQNGGFGVPDEILAAARQDFESARVSDQETLQTIKLIYDSTGSSSSVTNGTSAIPNVPPPNKYVLDPHSAIGIAASLRSIKRSPLPCTHHISLATAHPAKFAEAVKLALEGQQGFDFDGQVLPRQFVGLEAKEKRVDTVKAEEGWEGVREIIRAKVEPRLTCQ